MNLIKTDLNSCPLCGHSAHVWQAWNGEFQAECSFCNVRSFKNFGIIQTNHMGVIDGSYCGDNDQWRFPAYALRDTVIHKNDRICQFRIVKKQPTIEFEVVAHLNEIDRGGFGSTGKR